MLKYRFPNGSHGFCLLSLEIRDDLRKYVEISKNGDSIEQFVCPVEGCEYKTRLGPGALRMHIIMKSDPTVPRRYCPDHEAYYSANIQELGPNMVKYLSQLPRVES